jgi:thymidylate synthase (FAD)
MKFVETPQVELVGFPVMELDGVNQFLTKHNMEWPGLKDKLEKDFDMGDQDAEWLPEMAGRLCYMSFGGKGRSHEDHIKHLIEVNHFSVIEHSNFNFVIWDVSRSLTHELVRHRIASYSQLSQRYVDSSDVNFVIPPAIQELRESNPQVFESWKQSCVDSLGLYSKLTDSLAELYKDIPDKTEKRKKAREAARSVLPNCTETKIFVTMNGRSLRHFLAMRASAAADREIRNLAIKMYDLMKAKFPLIIHGIENVDLPDGSRAVTNKFREA